MAMLPICAHTGESRLSKCKWHRSANYARHWSTRRISPLEGSCTNVLASCKTLGMAQQPELFAFEVLPPAAVNCAKTIDRYTAHEAASRLLAATAVTAYIEGEPLYQFQNTHGRRPLPQKRQTRRQALGGWHALGGSRGQAPPGLAAAGRTDRLRRLPRS